MIDNNKVLLRKRMIARIEHLCRMGEPFSWSGVGNAELLELAQRVDDKNPVHILNQEYHDTIDLEQFKGKIWKRLDAITGKVEKRKGVIILYPSNVRERYGLADNEKFISHRLTGAKLRKAIEPPVRVRSTTERLEEQARVRAELAALAPAVGTVASTPAPATSVDWQAIAVAAMSTLQQVTQALDVLAKKIEEATNDRT